MTELQNCPSFVEELRRDAVPLLNYCYQDGLDGASGYPLEADAELQKVSEAFGIPLERLKKNELLLRLIQWMNKAYDRGREDSLK